MAFNNRNQRLNGFNPLSYMGDNAYQPPEFVTSNRAPTINDSQNFELGTIWLDIGTNNPPEATDIWMLVSLNGGSATWVQMSGGTGDVKTLTGNSGGAVSPDGLGNINVIGDGTTLNIVGNPGTNTLTASVATVFAATYTTDDANFAVPFNYNLNVFGGDNIFTSSAGDTVTISVSGTTNHNVQVGNAAGSLTSVAPSATAGIPLVSAGAAADPLFGTAVVAGGGTGATSFTAYSVICGGTTSTNPLQNVSGVGTSGQILTSNGAGALPTWQSRGASQCSFSVFLNGTAANVTGDGTQYTIAFDTELFDVGNNFNTGTYTFTAPVTGIYLFTVTFTLGNLGAITTQSAINTFLITTPRNYVQSNTLIFSDDTAQHQECNTYIVQLSSGDTVQYAIQSAFIAAPALTQSIVGGSAADPRTLWSGVLLI